MRLRVDSRRSLGERQQSLRTSLRHYAQLPSTFPSHASRVARQSTYATRWILSRSKRASPPQAPVSAASACRLGRPRLHLRPACELKMLTTAAERWRVCRRSCWRVRRVWSIVLTPARIAAKMGGASLAPVGANTEIVPSGVRHSRVEG